MTLLRYVVSEDCGVMINPDVVDVRSLVVWRKVSAECYEHMVYDKNGTRRARRSSTTCCPASLTSALMV